MVCVDMLSLPQKVKKAIVYHCYEPHLVGLPKIRRPSDTKKYLFQIGKHLFRQQLKILIERLIGFHVAILQFPWIYLAARDNALCLGFFLIFLADFIFYEFKQRQLVSQQVWNLL